MPLETLWLPQKAVPRHSAQHIEVIAKAKSGVWKVKFKEIRLTLGAHRLSGTWRNALANYLATFSRGTGSLSDFGRAACFFSAHEMGSSPALPRTR